MIAAATPSKAPFSIMTILPPPPSSAGVPKSSTAPLRSSLIAFNARKVPTADEAIRLWPQACPIPASASYSASTAIRGPSFEPGTVACSAVSSPAMPCSTGTLCPSRAVMIRSVA